jgi:hypothetical protein
MEGRLLLNIVIRESTAILELLSGKDETLLIGRDSFFVLNLGFDIVDSVGGLDFKSDGLARESLDEDLHASSKTENEVESRFFLNIVVRKSATIFELFAGEDQTLLIRRNAFFILDLAFDIVDGVRRLDLKSDGYIGLATRHSKKDRKGGLLLPVRVLTKICMFIYLLRKWMDAER